MLMPYYHQNINKILTVTDAQSINIKNLRRILFSKKNNNNTQKEIKSYKKSKSKIYIIIKKAGKRQEEGN